MAEVGYATLGIIPSFDGFARNLETGTSRAMTTAGTAGGARFGQAAGQSAGKRFGSVFSAAAKVGMAGALGAGALALKVGADSITQASDLNESLNAVNVTYGRQARAVKALGREAAESMGLSNAEFNGLAVQFSAFSKTIAGDGGDVVGTLDELTTRGSDFASVMNLEVNEALGLFQSGLAGETEPLRKYGIDLSAAAVEAHALATGIADAKGELSESEKVQARYSLLMEQTAKSQGDFANTSDSLANRQRILNASWDDARAKLGTALLPIMQDLTGYILEDGIPAFQRFSDWFVDEGIPAFKKVAEFAGDAAGVVKDLVDVFNDLPSEAKIAALGGLVTGGAYMKFGGRAAVGGGLAAAATAARPLPVFVTNPGFGGAGGGVAAVGPDGKPSKTGGGRSTKGGAIALLAGILGPQLIKEIKDEFMFPVAEGGPLEREGAFASAIVNAFEDVLMGKDFQGTFTAFDEIAKGAQKSAQEIVTAYDKLPETLQTRFDLLGVPESERELRHLLRVYDLTPREKRTTLELMGYDVMLDRIARVNRELDWAARPREARITITKAYAGAGYETRGGLQEGGGTATTQTGRSRAGGGLGSP